MFSPNGLFMLHQITLPFKNVSIEFTQVSCFCLGCFKKMVYTSGLQYFQGIPIGTPCFKTTLSLRCDGKQKLLSWARLAYNILPQFLSRLISFLS